MELATDRRGDFKSLEYLRPDARPARVRHAARRSYRRLLRPAQVAHPGLRLASTTTLLGYRPADLVKLDILVNGQPVDALSIIVHRDDAHTTRARSW